MNDNDIKCPKCGTKIQIDQEVITRKVRENIAIEEKKKLELNFTERLKQEKEQIEKSFTENQGKELEILKADVEAKNKKLNEFREEQLKLMKERSELEEAKKELEITTQRRLLEEKKILEEKLNKDFEEKKNFAEMELRKQLDDTKKALMEAQRKAQQGSMQTQGEVLELTLEENLKKRFGDDIIEPVGKGISGADIIQNVIAQNGDTAGIIAWEVKQTKAWTEDWVQKLKDDGHRVKANLLVLISNVLPKDIEHFGQYKGIWVTDYQSCLGMAAALRNNLLSVYSVALAQENSQDKAQVLYKHLTSQAFINRVQSISETHISMINDLEKEKLAMERIWAARTKQIERLSSGTRQVFNEIGGIVGGQYSGIEILEDLAQEVLPEPASEKDLPKKQKSETSKKIKNLPADGQVNLF